MNRAYVLILGTDLRHYSIALRKASIEKEIEKEISEIADKKSTDPEPTTSKIINEQPKNKKSKKSSNKTKKPFTKGSPTKTKNKTDTKPKNNQDSNSPDSRNSSLSSEMDVSQKLKFLENALKANEEKLLEEKRMRDEQEQIIGRFPT